jgi:hypothetical protein
MRTPWKFLSDLVSRKASEDPNSAQDKNAPDLTAIEYHPAAENEIAGAADRSIDPAPGAPDAQQTVTAATDPAPEPDVSDETVISADGVRDAAIDIAKDSDPSADARPFGDATKDEPVSPPPAKARQTRTSPKPAAAQSAVHVPEESTQPQPVVEKTVLEQIMEVDDEISELRGLLAQKLARQNAQLRKMLERYEP